MRLTRFRSNDPCHGWRRTLAPLLLLAGSLSSHAAIVTVGDFGSALTSGELPGFPATCAPLGDPACVVRSYDTTGNLAFSGNSGVDAVGSSSAFGPRHEESFANDGYYGNGSSWIGAGTLTWLKLDLGLIASLDTLTFGRNRISSCCNDRTASRVRIDTALSDDVFATGNDSNDGAEYSEALAWTSVAYAGLDDPMDTVKIDFDPGAVTARYVKLTFERLSLEVAIDEVEIFGTPRSVPSPAPAALLLMGLGLLGGARRLRR